MSPRWLYPAALALLGAVLLEATTLDAQAPPGAPFRDGEWIAEHLDIVYDSMPPAWVSQRNVMDDIWAPLGVRGVNFYAYGGPVTPHTFAARSDPESAFYQAWFGVYVVNGRAAATSAMPMRLAALDQRSWLAAMGDPAPVFTLHDSRANGTIVIAGRRRPLYAWDAETHSDLGPGTTPLAKVLGMPPAADWPRGLTAFHDVRLRGYFSWWYDAVHGVTVIDYACAASYEVAGTRRDYFPALDAALLPMMRTVRFESDPPPGTR